MIDTKMEALKIVKEFEGITTQIRELSEKLPVDLAFAVHLKELFSLCRYQKGWSKECFVEKLSSFWDMNVKFEIIIKLQGKND